MPQEVWQITLRTPEVQQAVHSAVLQGLQDFLALDVVPDAVRLSPVSPENPSLLEARGEKRRDTGHNRRTIDFLVEETEDGPKGYVFTQSGYGGWLEIGTRKMIARPYLYPALQLNTGKYVPTVAEKLQELYA